MAIIQSIDVVYWFDVDNMHWYPEYSVVNWETSFKNIEGYYEYSGINGHDDEEVKVWISDYDDENKTVKIEYDYWYSYKRFNDFTWDYDYFEGNDVGEANVEINGDKGYQDYYRGYGYDIKGNNNARVEIKVYPDKIKFYCDPSDGHGKYENELTRMHN